MKVVICKGGNGGGIGEGEAQREIKRGGMGPNDSFLKARVVKIRYLNKVLIQF